MPGSVSSEQSSFIVKIMYPLFENYLSINKFTMIIRKLAHFTLFMLLAIVFANYYLTIKIKKPYVITLFQALLVAIIDESIQLLIPGRAGLIRDIAIDFSGAIVGSLIVWTYFKYLRVVKP